MAENTDELRNGPRGRRLSRHGMQRSGTQRTDSVRQTPACLSRFDIQRGVDLRSSLDVEHDGDLGGNVQVARRLAGVASARDGLSDGIAHGAPVRSDGLGRTVTDLGQRENDLHCGTARRRLDRRDHYVLQSPSLSRRRQ